MRYFRAIGFAGAVLLMGSASLASAGDDLMIESRFFRASMSGVPGPSVPAVIVTSFSDPVFLPAPRPSYAAEANLTYVSAMKAELTGVYRLNQVDYLTSGHMAWDGKKEVLNEAIVLDGMLYAIFYYPRMHEGAKISLRLEVWRHLGLKHLPWPRETWDGSQRTVSLTDSEKIESAWGAGEKILNTEIATRLDDSVVFGFPVNGHAFFLSIQVNKQTADAGRDATIKIVPNDVASLTADAYVPPKPRVQVKPIYPESCQQKGIEGLVTLFVETDEAGKVKSVRVWQKADPDLDRSALDALRQWTFDPIVGKGGPAPSSFFMTVDYKLPVSGAAGGVGDGKKDKAGAGRDQ